MGLLREWFGPSTTEIWRQLSAKIGAHFIEGGTWRPDRVEAKFKEWTITLDTYQEPVGRATVTYTRIRAPYVNKDGYRFTIYRRNLFSNLAKHLGMQDLEVGDLAFDNDFIIKANDEAKVRVLIANPILRELIARQPALYMEVKDDEGWFGASFPDGVDELYLQVPGILKDMEQLVSLYQLFAETLNELCCIGSAYQNEPP